MSKGEVFVPRFILAVYSSSTFIESCSATSRVQELWGFQGV
jgi:hypothetical protein